jgi:hypothetical protein
MALQHVGALLPEKAQLEQEFLGIEDTRGTDDFVEWAAGPLNREIKRVALDGIDDASDYLIGELFQELRGDLRRDSDMVFSFQHLRRSTARQMTIQNMSELYSASPTNMAKYKSRVANSRASRCGTRS